MAPVTSLETGNSLEIGGKSDNNWPRKSDENSPFSKPLWPPRPYRDTINEEDDTGSFLLKGGNKSANHISGLSGSGASR